jgi:hypothetical protein
MYFFAETRWLSGVPGPAPLSFTQATPPDPNVDHSTEIRLHQGTTTWDCIVGVGSTTVTGTFTWNVTTLQYSYSIDAGGEAGDVYLLRGSLHAVCPGARIEGATVTGMGQVTIDVRW